MDTEQDESCKKLRGKYLSAFDTYNESDGHLWGLFKDKALIPWVHCLYCGVIRRADKKNNPCKGTHKTELRNQ